MPPMMDVPSGKPTLTSWNGYCQPFVQLFLTRVREVASELQQWSASVEQ
jgi:hypothetical protein